MSKELQAFGFSFGLSSQLFGRAVRQTGIFVGFLLMLVLASHADTNVFAVLNCKNRCYTNATIESVTPASVTIFWDGGGERISITNLPAEILSRYHYDPQAAQAYLDQQDAKKAAARERADEELAAVGRALGNLGPAQKLRIVKILSEIHLQIEAGGKVSDAYIHKLPADFFASLSELNQAKAEAARLETQIAQNPNPAKPPANPAPGVRYSAAQRAAANAQKNNANAANAAAAEAKADLAKVKARIKELEAKTNILAKPTDFINGAGVRQWEYQGNEADHLTSK